MFIGEAQLDKDEQRPTLIGLLTRFGRRLRHSRAAEPAAPPDSPSGCPGAPVADARRHDIGTDRCEDVVAGPRALLSVS